MFRVELHSSNLECLVSANHTLKTQGIRKRFFDSVAYLTFDELEKFNSSGNSYVCTVVKVSLTDKGLKKYQKETRDYNKTQDRYSLNNVLKATHENKYDKITLKQTSAVELSDLFGLMAGV